MNNIKQKKISLISGTHFFRLTYRSVLFVLLLISYISNRMKNGSILPLGEEHKSALFIIVWAIFAIEMIFRFFPSRYESPGCQKQFKRNYIKSGETEVKIQDNNSTMLVALIWVVLNVIIGSLRMINILDDGIMILLCSAYSICDVVCILFYCPFQSLLMKNKCCGTCRIYNWDYAMIFTPLFFVQRDYYWSLLAMSVILLIRWEITFYRHPERFAENTNEYLRCQNCKEKLCIHKKQLNRLRLQISEYQKNRKKSLMKNNP